MDAGANRPYIQRPIDELENLFEDGAAVNEKLLRGAGLIRGTLDGVKILARGAVTKKFHVEAESISATAKEKIEKAGGSVTLIQKVESGKRSK